MHPNESGSSRRSPTTLPRAGGIGGRTADKNQKSGGFGGIPSSPSSASSFHLRSSPLWGGRAVRFIATAFIICAAVGTVYIGVGLAVTESGLVAAARPSRFSTDDRKVQSAIGEAALIEPQSGDDGGEDVVEGHRSNRNNKFALAALPATDDDAVPSLPNTGHAPRRVEFEEVVNQKDALPPRIFSAAVAVVAREGVGAIPLLSSSQQTADDDANGTDDGTSHEHNSDTDVVVIINSSSKAISPPSLHGSEDANSDAGAVDIFASLSERSANEAYLPSPNPYGYGYENQRHTDGENEENAKGERRLSLAAALRCYAKGRTNHDGVNYYPRPSDGACVPLPRALTRPEGAGDHFADGSGSGSGDSIDTAVSPLGLDYRPPRDPTIVPTLEGLRRLRRRQQQREEEVEEAREGGGGGVETNRVHLRRSPSVHSRWLFDHWRLWEGELDSDDGRKTETTSNEKPNEEDAAQQPNPQQQQQHQQPEKIGGNELALAPFVTIGRHRRENINHVFQIDNFCVDESTGAVIAFDVPPAAAADANTEGKKSSVEQGASLQRLRIDVPDGRSDHHCASGFLPIDRMLSKANIVAVDLKAPLPAASAVKDTKGKMRCGGDDGELSDGFEAVAAASIEEHYRRNFPHRPLPSLFFPRGPALLFPLHSDADDNPSHIYHRTASAAALAHLLNTTNVLFLTESLPNAPAAPWCSAVCRAGAHSFLNKKKKSDERKDFSPVRSEGVGSNDTGKSDHHSHINSDRHLLLRRTVLAVGRAAIPKYLGSDHAAPQPPAAQHAEGEYVGPPLLLSEGDVEAAARGPPLLNAAPLVPQLARLLGMGRGSDATSPPQPAPPHPHNDGSESGGSADIIMPKGLPAVLAKSLLLQPDKATFLGRLRCFLRPYAQSAATAAVHGAVKAALGAAHSEHAIHRLYGPLLYSGRGGCEALRCGDIPTSSSVAGNDDGNKSFSFDQSLSKNGHRQRLLTEAHRRCAVPFAVVAIAAPDATWVNVSEDAPHAMMHVGLVQSEGGPPLPTPPHPRPRPPAPDDAARAFVTSRLLPHISPKASENSFVFSAGTSNYSRHVWHSAVRALNREATQLRLDAAADANANKSDDSGDGSDEGKKQEHLCNSLPNGLDEILLFTPSRRRKAPFPSAREGGGGDNNNEEVLAAPFGYVAEWRRRLVGYLGSLRRAKTLAGSGGTPQQAPPPAPKGPTAAEALRDYLDELFAALLEQLTAAEEEEEAGNDEEDMTTRRGVSTSVEDRERGETRERGQKKGGVRQQQQQRPQLMCYRKAYALQIRHPTGTGLGFSKQFRGALNSYAPPNCYTREVLNITHNLWWQRYGHCSSETATARTTLTAAPTPSPQLLPNADGRNASSSISQKAGDIRRNTNSSVQSREAPAEPMMDPYRGAHPLLTLPASEQRALRSLFFSSKERVEAILSEEAAALRDAGVRFLSGKISGGTPSSSSERLEIYKALEAAGGARIAPSSATVALPIVLRALTRVRAAQRRFDDVFMKYFERRRQIDGRGASGVEANNSSSVRPYQQRQQRTAGRPLRLVQLHRSAFRPIAVYRPLFGLLEADGLRRYIDVDFSEGMASDEATSASGEAAATTREGEKNDYVGSSPHRSSSLTAITPRARQVHAIMSADVIVGVHGADLSALAYAKPTAMATELVPPLMDSAPAGAAMAAAGYFAPTAFARRIGYLRVLMHKVETLPDIEAESAHPSPYFLHGADGAYGGQALLSITDLRQMYASSVCAWFAMGSVRMADDAYQRRQQANDDDGEGRSQKENDGSDPSSLSSPFDYAVPWWCRGGASAAVREMIQRTAAAAAMSSASVAEESTTAAERAPRDRKSGAPACQEQTEAAGAIAVAGPSLLKELAASTEGRADLLSAATAVMYPHYFTNRDIRSGYGLVEPFCPPLQVTELTVVSGGTSHTEDVAPTNATAATPMRLATAIRHEHLKRLQSECARGLTLGTYGAEAMAAPQKLFAEPPPVPEPRRAVEALRLRAEGMQSLLESVALGTVSSRAAQLAARLVTGGAMGAPIINSNPSRNEGGIGTQQRWGGAEEIISEAEFALLGRLRSSPVRPFASETFAANGGGLPSQSGTPATHSCGDEPIRLNREMFHEFGGRHELHVPYWRCIGAIVGALMHPFAFSFTAEQRQQIHTAIPSEVTAAGDNSGPIHLEKGAASTPSTTPSFSPPLGNGAAADGISDDEQIYHGLAAAGKAFAAECDRFYGISPRMCAALGRLVVLSANNRFDPLPLLPQQDSGGVASGGSEVRSSGSTPTVHVRVSLSSPWGGVADVDTRRAASRWIATQYIRTFGREADARSTVSVDGVDFSFSAECAAAMPPCAAADEARSSADDHCAQTVGNERPVDGWTRPNPM